MTFYIIKNNQLVFYFLFLFTFIWACVAYFACPDCTPLVYALWYIVQNFFFNWTLSFPIKKYPWGHFIELEAYTTPDLIHTVIFEYHCCIFIGSVFNDIPLDIGVPAERRASLGLKRSYCSQVKRTVIRADAFARSIWQHVTSQYFHLVARKLSELKNCNYFCGVWVKTHKSKNVKIGVMYDYSITFVSMRLDIMR